MRKAKGKRGLVNLLEGKCQPITRFRVGLITKLWGREQYTADLAVSPYQQLSIRSIVIHRISLDLRKRAAVTQKLAGYLLTLEAVGVA